MSSTVKDINFVRVEKMQTKMINIPSTVNDPKYRYKMPKLQLKIESKGNGIKTNLVNISDVSKHLHTEDQYILKFFGYEKATQTMTKETSKNSKTHIINGQFNYEDLIKILDKFIEKYICCPKCKYPEMYMFINDNRIFGKCESCPFTGELDNKHKIQAYILKNPPTYKGKAGKKKQQQIKRDKNLEEKAPKFKVEQIEETQQEQKDTIKKLFDPNNLQFGTRQLSDLIQYVKKFLDQRKIKDLVITSAELVSELKPLNLKKPLYAYIIFNAIFNVNIAKQVEQAAPLYKSLMKKLVGQNAQLETLLNLELLLLEVNKEKDLSKFVPTILMKLHQNQLLTEQFLLGWSTGGIQDIEKNFFYNPARDQEFIKMSQDFIDWLKGDDDQEQEEEKGQQINEQKKEKENE